jgi:hypothetical protein
MEVIYAVNCLDRPDTADLTVVEKNADAFAQGRADVGSVLGVGFGALWVWPIQTGNTPAKITAGQRSDRHRRHHPGPGDDLRVVGPVAR